MTNKEEKDMFEFDEKGWLFKRKIPLNYKIYGEIGYSYNEKVGEMMRPLCNFCSGKLHVVRHLESKKRYKYCKSCHAFFIF